ncbi:MAG: hypothetical protein RLY93_05525 [Sumerlaeia bacterium]
MKRSIIPICLLMAGALCSLPSPAPAQPSLEEDALAETLRSNVGDSSGTTFWSEWQDGTTPNWLIPGAFVSGAWKDGGDPGELLPYAANDQDIDEPNLFAPLNIQGLWQDNMWSIRDEGREEEFANRFSWTNGANFYAVMNFISRVVDGETVQMARSELEALEVERSQTAIGAINQAFTSKGEGTGGRRGTGAKTTSCSLVCGRSPSMWPLAASG